MSGVAKDIRLAQIEELIKKHRGLRGCEISEATGLSEGTVSIYVNELIDEGRVVRRADDRGKGRGLYPPDERPARRWLTRSWCISGRLEAH